MSTFAAVAEGKGLHEADLGIWRESAEKVELVEESE